MVSTSRNFSSCRNGGLIGRTLRALRTLHPTPTSLSLRGLYMQPGAFEIFISLTSFALFLIVYGMTYLKSSVLRPSSWDWGRGWRRDTEMACQCGGETT